MDPASSRILCANLALAHGTDFVFPGVSKPVRGIAEIAKSIPRSAPSGPQNAANAATHIFHIPYNLYPQEPVENTQVGWRNRMYTILNVDDPDVEDGLVVQWNLSVYRTPVAATSPDDADQEALFNYVDPTL